MKLNDVGPVIATRVLNLRGSAQVTIRLGKPEGFPDSVDYYCPYEIFGIGTQHVRYAGGVDLGFPVPDSLADLLPEKSRRK